MAKKYYQSNLKGSFSVTGVGDVPPSPSVLHVTNPEHQKILDKHPQNGHLIGFSEIQPQSSLKTLKADGTEKKAKKASGKDPVDPKTEVKTEVITETLKSDEVTNLQMAKKFLLDNFNDIDGKTLTNVDSIRKAAEGRAEFPNWK